MLFCKHLEQVGPFAGNCASTCFKGCVYLFSGLGPFASRVGPFASLEKSICFQVSSRAGPLVFLDLSIRVPG